MPYKTVYNTELFLQIQGSMIVSSVFEILIGFTGLLGVITHYISPITIGVVIILLGLPLLPLSINACAESWPIASG